MSKATEAADAIKRAAKQYEAFVHAAEILERIGSLENAEKEAKAAIDLAGKEREEMVEKLKKAQLSVKKAEELAAKKESDAAINAESILVDANNEALKIVSEAKAQAAKFKSDANANIEQALAGIESQIQSRNEVKAKLDSSIAVTQLQVDEMNAAADEAEKRLAKVNAAIAKLTSQ